MQVAASLTLRATGTPTQDYWVLSIGPDKYDADGWNVAASGPPSGNSLPVEVTIGNDAPVEDEVGVTFFRSNGDRYTGTFATP